MDEVKLSPGVYGDFSSHLSLKHRPNTFEFELTWTSPIVKAWLVMVDECVLRIDIIREGRTDSHSAAIANQFNRAPFLKCAIWDKKEVFISSNSRAYRFTIPPES